MRANRQIVIRARALGAALGSTPVVIATVRTDSFGAASTGLIAPRWPCDRGPLELSASVGGGTPSSAWVTRPYLVDASDPTAVPGLVLHPASIRSGVPEVDRVIDLVLRGDAVGLASLAATDSVPCTRGPDADGVPCPDGTDTGAAVERFQYGACHGGLFAYAEGIERPFSALLGLPGDPDATRAPLRLHSVERSAPAPGEDRPTFTLHFAFPDGAVRRGAGRWPDPNAFARLLRS